MSESRKIEQPFYDPKQSYEANYLSGPFGAFSNPSEVFSGAFFNNGVPKYEVFGIRVYLPFGIPAGPLLNEHFVTAALDKGFDIPVYKTVRTRPKKSHPFPNVVPVDISGDLTLERASTPLKTKESYDAPLSITNSFGVPSPDSFAWSEGVATAVAHARPGQMVWVSVEGTRWDPQWTNEQYVEDWVLAARLAKEAGAHVVEANLSCPNEGTTNLLCFDVDKVERIARAIKGEIGETPLVLKVAYFEDDMALRALVSRVGTVVDGIAAVNTISAEVVDSSGKQALPGEGRKRSGVCGDSIRWAGLDMVKRLHALREELGLQFVITGVGGVSSPEHFEQYRAAGADVVMSATGAMWNPYLAQAIKENLGMTPPTPPIP